MFNCKSTKQVKYHYGHFPVVVTLYERLERRNALFCFRLVSLKMSLHSWTVSGYNFRRAAIWLAWWSATIFRNYSVPEWRLISFSQEQLATYSYAPNYVLRCPCIAGRGLPSLFPLQIWTDPLTRTELFWVSSSACSVIFLSMFRDRDCP